MLLFPGLPTGLQLLISDFGNVNKIQRIIMGCEAIALCVIVCIYMYTLLKKVDGFR